MKGRWIRYSAAEVAFLKANESVPRPQLHAAFVERFERPEVNAHAIKAKCQRMGLKTGRTGCFVQGFEPANKGKPCPPGRGGRHPNAQRTQFKKGSLSGRAEKVRKPIGTERLSKDGYLERKIHDGLPFQSRWRAVHLIEWEALHGPIPEGMCLKCLTERSNTDPSNWELIPRAMLPRLNNRWGRNYDEASPELKPTIMAVAKLETKLRERSQ